MPRIAAGVDEPDDDRQPDPIRTKGRVMTYVHAGGSLGVLLELSCKSEFLASSEEFGVLMKDVAMHIAAVDPKYISREDVPSEVSAKQEESVRQETAISEDLVKKMEEFYQEVCLLKQSFIREPGITVGQLLATRSDEWGDEVTVDRFVRFRVGETATVAVRKAQAR